MMKTIKLLDLCCKAGGCSMGYFQAANDLGINIEITGVDIEPQPNYPFKFIQADAVDYLSKNWDQFTHLHASPPCQNYSCSTAMFRNKGKIYNDNLDELKALMLSINLPSVIENVPSAPIRPDVVLTGNMFGLHVIRKRNFELNNWIMMNPPKSIQKGKAKDGYYITVAGKGSYKTNNRNADVIFKKETILETWKFAMGINWMTQYNELAEAIPPAYTRYIGRQFFK